MHNFMFRVLFACVHTEQPQHTGESWKCSVFTDVRSPSTHCARNGQEIAFLYLKTFFYL